MPYKHDYDKILTRLTVILSRLNDGEALSVKELAKEFNIPINNIKMIANDENYELIFEEDGKKIFQTT